MDVSIQMGKRLAKFEEMASLKQILNQQRNNSVNVGSLNGQSVYILHRLHSRLASQVANYPEQLCVITNNYFYVKVEVILQYI